MESSSGEGSQSKGRIMGASLLVAGCCVGAGMLGLPVLTAVAGFVPSVFMFIIVWLFMVCTGLLLLEVNLWFPKDVNIVSMAGHTLGNAGRAVAWTVFLFLFYSLMIAYIAGSGELCSEFLHYATPQKIPTWIGGIFVTLLFGILVYMGAGSVDIFNRVLMLGLIVTYVLIVGMGIPHIKPELLSHQNWNYSLIAIPIMIVSFGYHNLIPSLSSYLKRDVPALRKTIIIGSFIPLLVYVVWEALILGMIPADTDLKQVIDSGQLATQTLKDAVGVSWILSAAQSFAFFAIVTSFLAVALSFVDFLADGLGIKKTQKGKLVLCSLALLPPLFFALAYPNIFLTALNYAGGFGAVILFGILPALMVWAGRYRQNLGDKHIVPGGKLPLVLVMMFSVLVIILQCYLETL